MENRCQFQALCGGSDRRGRSAVLHWIRFCSGFDSAVVYRAHEDTRCEYNKDKTICDCPARGGRSKKLEASNRRRGCGGTFKNREKVAYCSTVAFYSEGYWRNLMDPGQNRLFYIEWPRELNDSLEFHVELGTLLAEFSLRIGTLAERCLQERVLH
jgi:hypothetical protein